MNLKKKIIEKSPTKVASGHLIFTFKKLNKIEIKCFVRKSQEPREKNTKKKKKGPTAAERENGGHRSDLVVYIQTVSSSGGSGGGQADAAPAGQQDADGAESQPQPQRPPVPRRDGQRRRGRRRRPRFRRRTTVAPLVPKCRSGAGHDRTGRPLGHAHLPDAHQSGDAAAHSGQSHR